jgi:O-antigen ligase
LYSFITTAAALVCLVSAFVVFRRLHETSYLYNDSLSDFVKIQSIYFALMINLAIFSYIYLLSKKEVITRYRTAVYAAVFFLLIIHFLLASRIAIIILYSALLVFAFYYIVKRRKILEGVTLITGLLIGSIVMVKLFPKTLNRFREMLFTEYTYTSSGVESHYDMEITADQWNGANIRLAIWSCGWELARQNPLFGAQLGDKKDRMMEIYRDRKFEFALKTKRNMHNNYLDVLCTFGIIGLTLFLLAYFILPSIACYRANDGLGIFIVAAFAFSLITETYLDRSLGCVLFGFFSSLIAAYKKPAIE